MPRKTPKGKHAGSVLGGLFARLSAYMHTLAAQSVLLGWLLAYDSLSAHTDNSRICRFFRLSAKTKSRLLFFKLRFAAKSEQSLLLQAFEHAATRFFRSSLRSMGIYCLSFGGFLVSLNLANNMPRLLHLDFSDTFLFGCILMLSSLFMLPVKNKSIAACLRDSRLISYFLLDVFTLKHITEAENERPHPYSGEFLFLGVVCGVVSYLTTPKLTAFLLFMAVLLYMVLTRPENGILMICLLLPFADIKILVFLILLTLISNVFKTLRGKRAFHFNLCSGVCVLFGVVALSAFIVSFDPFGAAAGFWGTLCILLLAVLVITLIHSSLLADKCFRTLSLSTLAAAVYSLYGYVTVLLSGVRGSSWLTTLAGSTTLHTAFSVSSFACFLICMLPILLAGSRKDGKLFSLFAFFSVILCLFFTNSYYAVLSFAIALIIMMLLFHRQGLFTAFLAVLALYGINCFIPIKAILRFDIHRFVSIPNEWVTMTASYRTGLQTFFRKLWFCGTGFGTDAVTNASSLTGFRQTTTQAGASYTALTMCLGVPLVIVCVLCGLVFFSRLLSYIHTPNRSAEAKHKCSCLLCSLTSFLIYAFFVDVTADLRLCLTLFLLLSLGSAVTDSADNDYIPDYIEREYNEITPR